MILNWLLLLKKRSDPDRRIERADEFGRRAAIDLNGGLSDHDCKTGFPETTGATSADTFAERPGMFCRCLSGLHQRHFGASKPKLTKRHHPYALGLELARPGAGGLDQAFVRRLSGDCSTGVRCLFGMAQRRRARFGQLPMPGNLAGVHALLLAWPLLCASSVLFSPP